MHRLYIQWRISYQWDPVKAHANYQKHQVDFADAVGVFEEEWALTLTDQVAGGEQRFVTLGTDFLGRLLVVVYIFRQDQIRIISARPATKREQTAYEQKRV